MDPIEGVPAAGGNDPLKPIAMGHPLDQLAGSHERGVHGHEQGDACQYRDDHTEPHPVHERREVCDQVPLVLRKFDRSRERQHRNKRRDEAHRHGQKHVGLLDGPPVFHKTGGLDDRLDPRVGQNTEGDIPDEAAIGVKPRAFLHRGQGQVPGSPDSFHGAVIQI